MNNTYLAKDTAQIIHDRCNEAYPASVDDIAQIISDALQLQGCGGCAGLHAILDKLVMLVEHLEFTWPILNEVPVSTEVSEKGGDAKCNAPVVSVAAKPAESTSAQSTEQCSPDAPESSTLSGSVKWWKEQDADGEWNVGTGKASVCLCANEAAADKLLSALSQQVPVAGSEWTYKINNGWWEVGWWEVSCDGKHYCLCKTEQQAADMCTLKRQQVPAVEAK